jgi:hypothetical protein
LLRGQRCEVRYVSPSSIQGPGARFTISRLMMSNDAREPCFVTVTGRGNYVGSEPKML